MAVGDTESMLMRLDMFHLELTPTESAVTPIHQGSQSEANTVGYHFKVAKLEDSQSYVLKT